MPVQIPSSDRLVPPSTSDLATETANFMRAHWDEIVPELRVVSGETPSTSKWPEYDEGKLIDKIQQLAGENGYGVLAAIAPGDLRRIIRSAAYKRVTGTGMAEVADQGRKLLLEQRRADREARETH